tara:strand:- start:5819 stop:6862 length:1044 start_codon:yes stop_codon:yes gene_type:complete
MSSKIYRIIIILALSIIIINFSSSNINADEFALGEETTSYYAQNKQGHKIHFSNLNDVNFDSSKELILILGNSQTHGINQKKNKDVNYVEILDSHFNSNNIISFSLPNATLNEFYLISLYLTEKFNISQIVLPVFFDDFRENEIRPEIVDFLNSKISIDKLPNSIKQKILYVAEEEHHLHNKSTQDLSEQKLNDFFNKFRLWKNRENLRVQLFTFLYKLRNTVFFISPSSIRYKIKESYDQNLNSLYNLLDNSYKNNIQVLTYIPPIRKDVKIPYDLTEYSDFKKDIKLLKNDFSNLKYADLDSIVKGEFWGYKNSTNLLKSTEYDFMHFNYYGHKILADTLKTLIK